MHLSKGIILGYGFSGFLFSFAALPLYLVTPVLYENKSGITLSIIGLILMIVRFSDAITDPIIGRLIDKTNKHRFLKWLVPSIIGLSVGFFLLMNPPDKFSGLMQVIIWLSITLFLVSISNGAASIAYQSWVLSLTNSSTKQIQLVTSREMFTLFGVVTASFFATQRMFFEMSMVVFMCCFIALISFIPLYFVKLLPQKKQDENVFIKIVFSKETRSMFLIFALNALANSIPALLFIFFVQDILLLSNEIAGFLLITYFLFAILSMPFWAKKIDSHGPILIWRIAIFLSIIGFIGTLFLDHNDFLYFLLICAVTGFSLGAELLCPPVILANKINELGHRGHHESSYFGILNLFVKLSLALASGTVLPVLAFYGYSASGSPTQFSLTVLQFLYAGVPCFLKLISMLGIHQFLKK